MYVCMCIYMYECDALKKSLRTKGKITGSRCTLKGKTRRENVIILPVTFKLRVLIMRPRLSFQHKYIFSPTNLIIVKLWVRQGSRGSKKYLLKMESGSRNLQTSHNQAPSLHPIPILQIMIKSAHGFCCNRKQKLYKKYWE